MKKYAVIVAGGSGTRMSAAGGSEVPKQFLLLGEKPLLMHTVSAFYTHDAATDIILVLPESQIDYWKGLCDEYSFNVPLRIVSGGETRFHSVKNGLSLVHDEGVVAVHDGARPLITPGLIGNLYTYAFENGNCVPYTRLNDSIRIQENGSSYPIDRNKCRLIQTPQCFNSLILKKAYESDYKSEFTDDASVAEASGEKINLVEGDARNIKITTPADLAVAAMLINVLHY